jgi:hypothetical protein
MGIRRSSERAATNSFFMGIRVLEKRQKRRAGSVPLENLERSERERIILLSEFSPPMPASLLAFLITLGSILRSRLDLQLETLALRHQIGVLEIYESPFTDFSPKGGGGSF